MTPEAGAILIAEDDDEIRVALERILRYEGYQTSSVADGAACLEALAQGKFDLVVLDLMLPYVDGVSVCRAARAKGDHTPVLMLTARTELEDRVRGLDAGADDYVVKPFELQELLARVRALLRRGNGGEQRLVAGPLSMDVPRRRVLYDETVIELTRTEFALLEVFMHNLDIVLERALLYEKIWGYDFGDSSRSLDMHVSYLRRKLEAAGMPRLLETVRGVGFVLRPPAGSDSSW